MNEKHPVHLHKQLEMVSDFPTRQHIKPLARESCQYCGSILVSPQQQHLHYLPAWQFTYPP